jgi:hypothetical protein
MSSLGCLERSLIGAVLMAGALAGAGCNGQDFSSPFDPDGSPRLLLVPTSLTMDVGEQSSIAARLGETGIDQSAATWSSADPSVASVDEQGNVTCVGTGTALITAVVPDPAGGDDLRDSLIVTCNTPPPFKIDVDSFTHRHVIGVSPCPDPVGDVTITNPTGAQVAVEIASDKPGLSVDRGAVSLRSGESATLRLFFNCSVRESFIARVTLTSTDAAGRAHERTVLVDVTVE